LAYLLHQGQWQALEQTNRSGLLFGPHSSAGEFADQPEQLSDRLVSELGSLRSMVEEYPGQMMVALFDLAMLELDSRQSTEQPFDRAMWGQDSLQRPWVVRSDQERLVQEYLQWQAVPSGLGLLVQDCLQRQVVPSQRWSDPLFDRIS
jgi:hypothetical protein